MYDLVKQKLEAALDAATADQAIVLSAARPEIRLEAPRRPEHGDFATSLALELAKLAHKSPRAIAEILVERLGDAQGLFEGVEIAGPGFINLRVAALAWAQALERVADAGENFGRGNSGAGQTVLVEFISANPTGPLHVGHGRGAVTGDVVATLLEWSGYEVTREYYVNDAGNQVKMLASSVHARYLQALGVEVTFPEKGYQGDYIVEVADALLERDGERWKEALQAEWEEPLRAFAVERMLDWIRRDLEAFGISFDHFSSERALHASGAVESTLGVLKAQGLLYESEDGALFFRATDFGDDKDRAVKKRDGQTTYLAADIAYHWEKLQRGFAHLINVWGADHGGYVVRLKSALQALGGSPDALEVLLVQMVNLTRNGEAVRMGKRSGEFVTLREVIDEVGRDAARFFVILRRSDAQFEFDLELAKKNSMDNPVHYVKYGHARCASLLVRAQERGYTLPGSRISMPALKALNRPDELKLIQRLMAFPAAVQGAAEAREPHRIVYYLQETIAQFHSYYTRTGGQDPILSEDEARRDGRLYLVMALKQVLANGLALLGVEAPARMERGDVPQGPSAATKEDPPPSA